MHMHNPKVDLDEMARLGRLSQRDAQNLHSVLCGKHELRDADSVIADWNRRSPDARWNCPDEHCDNGRYYRELTGYVMSFMRAQIKVSRERRGMAREDSAEGKKHD